MKKIKVIVVFGTRPEAIKMAPVILELKKNPQLFDTIVLSTGQHREMLQQVLTVFGIRPDYSLDCMQDNQGLSDLTMLIMKRITPILEKEQPQLLLVHGDTTSAFAASLAAVYLQIPVGHVEAGLRTYNKFAPFPEEMNRQMIDAMTDFYFAPTQLNQRQLINEGKDAASIFVTGNTVIDAFKYTIQDTFHHEVYDRLQEGAKIVLVTMHRRENFGQPMFDVMDVIKEIRDEFPDVEIVFPVHLNPKVRKIVYEELDQQERIHLISPLDVIAFHNLLKKAYIVLSDSGGVQEEAPALATPVLVLRTMTERPEGVASNNLKLVGTSRKIVKESLSRLLSDPKAYEEMTKNTDVYGNGTASIQIVAKIAELVEKKYGRQCDGRND